MAADPLVQFQQWLAAQLAASDAQVPTACCLATIGTDGYPNARFLALKGIQDGAFVITGPSARKGLEINHNPQVALTFWWAETGRQVRIQGIATSIPEAMADHYFAERHRDSQIVAHVSQQGAPLVDAADLQRRFDQAERRFRDQAIPRPDTWCGFAIQPIRIEFLEFKASRFHERHMFHFVEGQWVDTALQP